MELSDEKEKAQFAHKLEIKRIIIDKLLIGVIIFLCGFAANIALENYRNKLTTQKFFLEKKLDAIQAVSDAYSKMYDEYDRFTIQAYEKPNKQPKNINYNLKSVDDFIIVSTRWSSVLSKEFCNQLNYYSWIYSAFDELENAKKYRSFIFDLDQKFHLLCRKELGLQTVQSQDEFALESWSFQQGHSKGAEAYLEVNFENWKRWKQSKKNSEKTLEGSAHDTKQQ